MTRTELQDYGGEGPIWGLVQQLATERWTGQLVVGIDPRIELSVSDGRVYFAQRTDDPPLGARLVGTGVLTFEQLRNGGVKVGDTISLARLFQREPSVDRDAVELTIERLTEQLLAQFAEHPVGQMEVRPLQHHPSGIHQWWLESHPAPPPDVEGPMAALREVVSTLSGEVPVVTAAPQRPFTAQPVLAPPAPPAPPTPAPAPAPAAAMAPPAPFAPLPRLAPLPPTFDAPTVPAHPSAPARVEAPVAAAPPPLPDLPQLPDLGLAPLPRLGTAGTRIAAPEAPPQPAPAAAPTGPLPRLASDPITASIPIVRAAEEARAEQAARSLPSAPVAQLAASIAAADVRSRAPQMLTLDGLDEPRVVEPAAHVSRSPELDTEAAAPTPPAEPVTASIAPDPVANPAGAPPHQTADEIWEMVDELLGLPRQTPATTQPSTDRPARRFFRRRG